MPSEFDAFFEESVARADPDLEPALRRFKAELDRLRAANDALRREKRGLLDELEATNRGTLRLTTELEAQYRQLFETAVAGIYKTPPEVDRYHVANPAMATILGYEDVDALDEAVESIRDDVFVDPVRYEEYRDTLRAAGHLADFEYRVRRADGEIRWVSDSTTALWDEDGALDGYQGGVVDITARKDRERRLQDHRDKLGVLNQIVRHDIRNDMNVIIGWTSVLEAHVDEDGADALARVTHTSEHVVELTRIVRDFMAMLTEETDQESRVVDVVRIVERELDAHRTAFPEAHFRGPDRNEPVPVLANETLSSVFQNLFHNAVQHNDKATPAVSVTVEDRRDVVVVRVADNGPGIPERQHERLFEKYEKGPGSTGTGLGLYLIKVFVDDYGGSIRVERNDPEGTIFELELVAAPRPE